MALVVTFEKKKNKNKNNNNNNNLGSTYAKNERREKKRKVL